MGWIRRRPPARRALMAFLAAALASANAGGQTAPGVFLNSGIDQYRQHRFDRAVADLTEALRIDPSNALAYYYRACAWGQKRQFSHAVSDFTEVIRLEPTNASAYAGRAYA